ncbi:hypothetical protein D3C85_1653680 [compost metagenome]
MGRLHHCGDFQAELAHQVVVGGVDGCHAKLRARRFGDLGQGLGAQLAQALGVGAGVLAVVLGVVRVELA